jgi:hypothetical protein
MHFRDYMQAALTRVLEDEKAGVENGDLAWFHGLCQRGVRRNWSELTPKAFLQHYHRCVAAVAKKVAVVEKNLPDQNALFRHHDAGRIVREQDAIRAEWGKKKCFLSPAMVRAVITTAGLVDRSWDDFKSEYLLLPGNEEAESLQEWRPAHVALDRLPMVGEATAWYLIRNLYGARVFKPDVHICAIAWHFFPDAASPLDAMSKAVKSHWAEVCQDERLLPVHLGKVDYVLWWYRASTGLPEQAVAATC